MSLHSLRPDNNLAVTRCGICKIRSYSFCRCLKDGQLKIFSEISSERTHSNKENIFLQQEAARNL
ncbi:MAG: hypothetical protein QF864_02620, partial [SAR202 cluster bacterium]|nr:hypothetical protein [SAR202 cluster bacterium]